MTSIDVNRLFRTYLMLTKTAKTAKERAILRSRAELADHIAAVLAHPMTSARLFNTIADELSDLLEYDWTSPAMVLRALDDDDAA